MQLLLIYTCATYLFLLHNFLVHIHFICAEQTANLLKPILPDKRVISRPFIISILSLEFE